MKVTFKVLLYLALTSMTCEGSFATWNGTHWGMQPSDVQQATGAKAKKSSYQQKIVTDLPKLAIRDSSKKMEIVTQQHTIMTIEG